MNKRILEKKWLDKALSHKWILFLAAYILVFTVSIFLGRYKIPISEFKSVISGFGEVLRGEPLSNPNALIICNIRLPRLLLASFVGAGLSISGLVYQKVFKNPIASPDILGVTSGASFGAALAIVLPISLPGTVQIFAFFFGMLALILVYLLTKTSKNDNLLYLILSGMVVSAFFSALLSLVKYLADPYQQLPSIVFWSMGGLYKANWLNAIACGIVVIPFVLIIHRLRFKLKILSLNDDVAKTMGLEVTKFRNAILCLVSFVVCFCVSITGTISWIALLVPHITRILLGNKDESIYIITSLVGATTLIMFDDVARCISSTEIPVGILTAAIGAPVFAYLLLFKKTV